MKVLNFVYLSVLWIASLPPTRFLYGVSDFLFIMIYHIFKYRQKVTTTNLRNAFPEKQESEIKEIAKKFYRHLCDLLVESIKAVHYKENEMYRRLSFKNPELIQSLYDQKKSIILVSGHTGNWDWLGFLGTTVPHKFYYTARELKNQQADYFINYVRQRWGGKLAYMKDTLKTVLTEHKKGSLFMMWLLADQKPPKENPFWTIFLNQETSFYLGAEKMAKKLNLPIVFMDVRRLKRGHYEVEFQMITENPQEFDAYELTSAYIRALEENIKKRPENWLWSHRRWKNKRPENIPLHA